jgi:UDP-GlcNAc:undecaprenyl-phosphate GlcNAc-1-phosphate transferase
MNKTESFLLLVLYIVFSFIIQALIYYKRTNISNYLKVNDLPDKIRKFHKQKTPLVASFSIFLIFIFTILLNIKFSFFNKDFNIILLCSILMFLLGFFDDRFSLNPYKKIILSIIIFMFSIIISDSLIINKFYIKSFDTFFILKNFSLIFTILCLILLVNALNLIDGINGLAVGVITFWLFHNILIFKLNSNLNLIIFFLIINLAIIFINIYKEKYFLGDSGALLLSSFTGLLIIKNMNEYIEKQYTVISAEEIFVIFMLPGIDMLRLFISRLLKKKNPFIADNNHLHHLLIRKFSLQFSLLIYFLLINIPIILAIYLKLNSLVVTLFFIIFYALIISYLNKKIVY